MSLNNGEGQASPAQASPVDPFATAGPRAAPANPQVLDDPWATPVAAPKATGASSLAFLTPPPTAGIVGPYTERRPRPIALTAASNVATRNHKRPLPLRRAFAERPDNSSTLTPLARLLRGGRGGSVRLRLYLSYLWLGAAPPHELIYPARAWAELLDLDEPETAGARRVADAVRWLEKNEFITVTNRAGAPNVIRLLSDTGSGKDYETPGSAFNRLRRTKPEAAQIHRYIQLPPELWTSGWMAVLSQAALAMLIILRIQVGAKDPDTEEVWIAPDYAEKAFLLSEETRTRGLRELQRAGLISIRRRQLVATDSFDFRRFRNVYQLHLAALSRPAMVPVPIKDDRSRKSR